MLASVEALAIMRIWMCRSFKRYSNTDWWVVVSGDYEQSSVVDLPFNALLQIRRKHLRCRVIGVQ
jgi:hypothetical protein